MTNPRRLLLGLYAGALIVALHCALAYTLAREALSWWRNRPPPLAQQKRWREADLAALRAQIPGHPDATVCPVNECSVCGLRDCPRGEEGHYWHDGCPACDGAGVVT